MTDMDSKSSVCADNVILEWQKDGKDNSSIPVYPGNTYTGFISSIACWVKISADNILKYFLFFPENIIWQ